MIRLRTTVLVILLVNLTWVCEGHAQAIHLAPPFRQTLPKNTIVLRLQRSVSPPANVLSGATIQVEGNQLVIAKRGGDVDQIPLAGRTIRDVIQELRSKYKDAIDTLQSQYLSLSTSYLDETEPLPFDGAGGGPLEVRINASPDAADVRLGFGLVLSPSPTSTSDTSTNNSGLLSNAGFQLDVLGGMQFNHRPAKTTFDWVPNFYLQPRIGLQSNQQLNVKTSDAASSQFETALQQANQIGLTAEFPLEWKLPGKGASFFLTPGYGINWTQLDPFKFPTIPINVAGPNGSTSTIKVDAADFFDSEAVDSTRHFLDRVFPLSEFDLTGTFSFRRKTAPLFYFGGGLVWSEQTERTISYSFEPDGLKNPIPDSLKGQVNTPMERGWRAVAGFLLAGVLDIRIDAVGPIGSRDRDAMLRVIIGKAFPVTGQ